MTKYCVQIQYSGVVEFDIEANNASEAKKIAKKNFKEEFDSIEIDQAEAFELEESE